jgi:hypothetical protein
MGRPRSKPGRRRAIHFIRRGAAAHLVDVKRPTQIV